MKVPKWIRKHESIYFVLMSVLHAMRGDKKYIQKCLYFNRNPDLLEIKHPGKNNQGKIIYYIREQGNGYGFFAEFKVLLEELLYADCLGLQPYVVYGERFLYYEPEGIEGEKNAFRYYFQPIGKNGDEKKSLNVLMAKDCHNNSIESRYGVKGYDVPNALQSELARMIAKYISFKPEIQCDFDQAFMEMFPEGNILGIHYRGTDFKMGYNIHPVEVQIEQMIESIREAEQEYLFQYIFLATDEQGIYESLREELGERVKQYSDVFRGNSKVSVAFSKSNRKNHHFRLGYEVLRDVYSLSRCDGLIAGVSQVSFSARLFKRSRQETYRFEKVIDNGVYSSEKEFDLQKVYGVQK